MFTFPAHCQRAAQRHVKMQVLFLIKSMLKGAIACGIAGIFVGGVVAAFIWWGSNLGPPVGMFYGAIGGAILGALLGLAFSLKRLLSSRRRTESDNSASHAETS